MILHKQKVGWLQITARNTTARYPPGERPYNMLPWKIHLRESSLAAIQPVLAAVPQKQYRSLLFCRKLLSILTVSSSLTAFSSCFTLWYLFLILFFWKALDSSQINTECSISWTTVPRPGTSQTLLFLAWVTVTVSLWVFYASVSSKAITSLAKCFEG